MHAASQDRRRGRRRGIPEYLDRMPFTAWQPPAPEILDLQAINRRIVRLTTELTREKNRRHASEFAGASGDAIAHHIEVNVGNRHLRAALYMPALVAIQHEPNVKAFYKKLVGRGKKPMRAK